MMRKLIVMSVLSLFLVSPVVAQTSTSEPATDSGSRGIINSTPSKREAIRDNVVEKREAIKTNTAEKREAVRQGVATKREEVKADIEAKREEFKAKVDEKRAEVKANMDTRRDALKVQVQKVKDERKRGVVERIDARLGELNERMLNHFSNVLGKLEDVLEKIASRADKAEQRGLNVASVRSAISEALKSIETARAAIQTQTGKTYTITVTSEDKLRADVGKARKALHEDLAKVREAIKAVHDAVRRAAVALAQIPRVDEVENTPSTTSGTPSNQ